MILIKNQYEKLLGVFIIYVMIMEVLSTVQSDEFDNILSRTTNQLSVIYPQVAVEFSKELTPLQVKDEPSVNWQADSKTYYTLMMIDPDAPSRQDPKFRTVKHWLVGNILGNNIKTGETIAEYVGSGPPKGTGLHRYIFLVYKQDKKINFEEEPKTIKTSRAHRLSFSLNDFLKKYSLHDPEYANFFIAQWDKYVEERNKNITN